MKNGSWGSAMSPLTPICSHLSSRPDSGVRLPSTALRSRRASTSARSSTETHQPIQPPPSSDRARTAWPKGVERAAGCSKASTTHDVFREKVKESIQKNAESLETDIDTFTSHFYYQSLDVNDDASYQEMDEMMRALETKYNTHGNRMFYLAMAPEYFGVIANNLKKHGMKD